MPDYAKGGLSELVRSKIDENLQILSFEFETNPAYDGTNWTYPDQLDASNSYIPNDATNMYILHTDYNGIQYHQAPKSVSTIQISDGVLTTPMKDGVKLLINGSFCTVYNNRLLSGQHYSRTLRGDITGTFNVFVLPSDWTGNMLTSVADYVEVNTTSVNSDNIVIIK